MQELATALEGIEVILGFIFLELLAFILFKNCNAGYEISKIEKAIKDLEETLKNKKENLK